jgi:hypothetical protein
MKNINDAATLRELQQRLDTLKPDSQRQWGKMTVSQMMAHLSASMEGNLGDRVQKQNFMGRIFGKMAKRSIVRDQPLKQSLPTAPAYLITDIRDFNTEKERLRKLITRLSAADPAELEKIPHPFFGKMTKEEWNTVNYNHLDHHFRQFGA